MTRTVNFTSLGIDEDKIVDPRSTEPDQEEWPRGWESDSPRFSFRLLLGYGLPWGTQALWHLTSAGYVCRACGRYETLPRYACCLNDGCNRTGRDREIPPPTALDLARRPRRSYRPDPVLAGGTGAPLAGRGRLAHVV